MVMPALVTLTALALSRAGRPAEHAVGLESVAPEDFLRREIRALNGPRRSRQVAACSRRARV